MIFSLFTDTAKYLLRSNNVHGLVHAIFLDLHQMEILVPENDGFLSMT